MKRLVFLLLIAAATTAFASEPTASQIVKNVQKNYDRTSDATIQFTQTVVYPLSKLSKTISGTLYIAKGNKYRIETGDYGALHGPVRVDDDGYGADERVVALRREAQRITISISLFLCR